MKPARSAVVLLVCTTAHACGGGELGWSGTMTDSAGVTLVANTDVGIWAPGQEWALEEEIRIGVGEGEPEYQFGSVHRVAVDSRDRILVLDGIEQHIQVYSPDGVYRQTIGRRGEGPGELLAAMFLLVGPGDTLLVPDGRNLRFNRYAPDGSPIGSLRMPLEAGRPMMFKSAPSGVMAAQIRPSATPGEPVSEDPTDVIVLLASDGAVTDTLVVFPSGEMIGPGGVRVFGPEPTWDLADGSRLVLGVTDDYRIQLYSHGHLDRIITKAFQRKPVSVSDQDAIMGEMERRWATASISEEMKARLRSRWTFADFYPAYASLAFGPTGTIWVQQMKPVTAMSDEELRRWQDAKAAEWDVFDPEGRFLGVVTMPQRFVPMEFRGNKVYGMWRDEHDVEYVVRLRIVGDVGVAVSP